MDTFVDNLRFDLVLAVGARRGASIGRLTVARTPALSISSFRCHRVVDIATRSTNPSRSNVSRESARSLSFRPGTQTGSQILIGTGKPEHAEIVEAMADDLQSDRKTIVVIAGA